MRPAVVFGQLHAGLALTRALGREGVPVYGVALDGQEFGLRSRYLESKRLVRSDEDVLRFLGDLPERPVLFPERDEHVAFVLRNWDAVHKLADVPLPDDPEIVLRLRRKERLPAEGAAAGVHAPATVLARDEETIRAAGLQPPLLVKPVEGQEFALAFGEKVVVAPDADAAVSAWRRAHEHGFDTIVQELIPDSHDFVFSLLTYIGREGEPLANVTGRKGPPGPAALRDERGLRGAARARGRGAGAKAPPPGRLQGIRARRARPRPPRRRAEAGRGEHAPAGVGRDSHGPRFQPCPGSPTTIFPGRPIRANGVAPDGVSWIYMAKDVWVSAQMARRGELRPRAFLSHYLRRNKVRAVFAADDPLPALASLGYLRSRI